MELRRKQYVDYSDGMREDEDDVTICAKRSKRETKQPSRFADYVPPLIVAMQLGDVGMCRLILERNDTIASDYLRNIARVPHDVRVQVLELLILFGADTNVLIQFRPFFSFVLDLMRHTFGTHLDSSNRGLVAILLRHDQCTFLDEPYRASKVLAYLYMADLDLFEIMLSRNRLPRDVPSLVAQELVFKTPWFLPFLRTSSINVSNVLFDHIRRLFETIDMREPVQKDLCVTHLFKRHFLIPLLCYLSNDPDIRMYFRLMTHTRQCNELLCDDTVLRGVLAKKQGVLSDIISKELQNGRSVTDRLYFFEHRTKSETVDLLRRDLPLNAHTVAKALHVISVFETKSFVFGYDDLLKLDEHPFFVNYLRNAKLIVTRLGWTIQSHYLFPPRKRREVYTMLLVIKRCELLQLIGDLWKDIIFPYVMTDDDVTLSNAKRNSAVEKYGIPPPRVTLKFKDP